MLIKKSFIVKTAVLSLFLFLILSSTIVAQNEELVATDPVCAVYFTALGCSNCAIADQFLFQELLPSHQGNVVIIEYRPYFYPLVEPPLTDKENNPIAEEYYQNYLEGSSVAVPLLLIGESKKAYGRFEVLEADTLFQESLQERERTCALANGTSIPFGQLDISGLEGHPSFWGGNRVLCKEEGGSVSNDSLRLFLTEENPALILEQLDYAIIESKSVPVSDGEIFFENAVKIGGWLFRWNGENLPAKDVPFAGEAKEEKDICPSCRLGLIYICGAIIAFITIISFFSWRRKRRQHN